MNQIKVIPVHIPAQNQRGVIGRYPRSLPRSLEFGMQVLQRPLNMGTNTLSKKNPLVERHLVPVKKLDKITCSGTSTITACDTTICLGINNLQQPTTLEAQSILQQLTTNLGTTNISGGLFSGDIKAWIKSNIRDIFMWIRIGPYVHRWYRLVRKKIRQYYDNIMTIKIITPAMTRILNKLLEITKAKVIQIFLKEKVGSIPREKETPPTL